MAFAYILIFIICVLLILFVLVQNSKGGGLAAGFTGSQIMGVRKTADFLEKATWTLAGALIVLSIVANLILPGKSETTQSSAFQEEVQKAYNGSNQPRVPVSAPKNNKNQKSQPTGK